MHRPLRGFAGSVPGLPASSGGGRIPLPRCADGLRPDPIPSGRPSVRPPFRIRRSSFATRCRLAPACRCPAKSDPVDIPCGGAPAPTRRTPCDVMPVILDQHPGSRRDPGCRRRRAPSRRCGSQLASGGGCWSVVSVARTAANGSRTPPPTRAVAACLDRTSVHLHQLICKSQSDTEPALSAIVGNPPAGTYRIQLAASRGRVRSPVSMTRR